MNDIEFDLFLSALDFASHKHIQQKRKDWQQSPYINHPIQVVDLLWRVGEVRDAILLTAALLHDTIEDTQTTPEEIKLNFGQEVLDIVLDVTDDTSLSKDERKQKQIDHAPFLSPRAKQLKLADKICNIYDANYFPPTGWSEERKLDYINKALRLVDKIRGTNPGLETYFDELISQIKGRWAL
jgi:guanosine-3',5'-bis(diphosphate) 3'-pyrophosphohydrolase